jgi:hypothetical protein
MESKPQPAGPDVAGPALQLGKLENVDPRSVWPSEARDFTPWLRDHPDYLADALGIDLEFTAAEHPVGGFSLDLIGRDLTNNSVLIVENQLEQSDHNHLGQLLTYAAGTEAVTVVWVANRIRDEHRQVIDWLNQLGTDRLRFFAIDIEVAHIGESQRAPYLRLVAQPNDWQERIKRVETASSLSGKSSLYFNFWSQFLDRIQSEHPSWTRARKPQTVNWVFIRSPIPGVPLSVAFQQGKKLSVELYISAADAIWNLELFNRLNAQRSSIEAGYGRELAWEEAPGKQYCRIADRRDGEVTATANYDEYISWAFDCIGRWQMAAKHINLAELPQSPPATEINAPEGI